MKLIKYTLTAEGTIPEYVTDGGYLPVENNKAWPQNLDLIGVAIDTAPQSGFANKEDLLAYAQSKNLTFTDATNNEVVPLAIIVNDIWNRLG